VVAGIELVRKMRVRQAKPNFLRDTKKRIKDDKRKRALAQLEQANA